jgi:hypothetical protein
MVKNKNEAKHTVIIDADLHVQDPEEIILSYFNTSNDSQLVQGPKKGFKNKIAIMFVSFVMMKFFFEEMFKGWMSFILIGITALILGFIFSEGIYFMVRSLYNSTKNDSVRGIFYQLIFITIIVVVIGIFI